MARTVKDVAILLGCMTGIDPRDPATEASDGRQYHDYTQFLALDGLKDARIGVARNYFGVDHRLDAVISEAIILMRSLDAEIVDPANIETDGQWDKTELRVLLYEFKADLNAYLGALPPNARVHSIQDVIEFNQHEQARAMPIFGQERMVQAAEKGPLTNKRYLDALSRNHRLTRAEGIDAVLFKHNLDAIIAPTGPLPWLIDWVTGDHYRGPDTSSAAAVAGYPHITVPAGYACGLPVGISFIGTAWQEPRLLRLAYAYEQASRKRVPPQFKPSVEFV
jgi:amidase